MTAKDFRDNYLKAAHFDHPDHIPVRFSISKACWHHYDNDQLFDLMASHPILFPNFQRPTSQFVPKYSPNEIAGEPFIDSWGCTWQTTDNGLVGVVSSHPLESWPNFSDFSGPDPLVTDGLVPIDWPQINKDNTDRKQRGELIFGGLPHGHTFMKLYELRGYENLIFDMTDSDPRLASLIDMVSTFNLDFVEQSILSGAEVILYPDDLGMQFGPMVSPAHFRRYIQPSYKKLIDLSLSRSLTTHIHTDGDIRSLLPDLLDCQPHILNIQDNANGSLDWIRDNISGRVCIELDIDRMHTTVSGNPSDISDLIDHEVNLLGDSSGGLMLFYELGLGVPLVNVAAVMDSLEHHFSI